MKKMMNKKTNGLLAKLGLLAMAAGMVMGCSTTLNTQKTEEKIKAGNGIVFAFVPPFGAKKSVANVCEKFATANDERCARQSEFNAYTLVITNPHVSPVSGDIVDILVPKRDGELEGHDIVKVRLAGLRPAFFEMVMAKKGDKDCYYGIDGTWAGVICPKHNWTFRKELNL